jgi:hypothetical protein
MWRTERHSALPVGENYEAALIRPHDLDVYRHLASHVRKKLKGKLRI